MATATSSGGTSLNLMACVRESSPQQEDLVTCDVTDSEMARNAADPCSKKRRFHPFRGLRRMFRKKTSRHQQPQEMQEEEQPCATPVQNLDSHRSRSTSELLSGDEPCPRRRSGNGLFPCHSGLSVSHDSVFTAEHRTPHSSSEDLDTAQSSSSLSIQQLVLPGVRAELFDAVRRRRGRGDCTSEDDEDLGLPRSPCNSPTTADVLLEKGLKENATKSHSTCSDGSLLSMGSSEMDEDSLGQHSGHSSKISLHEKKAYLDSDIEFDFGVSATPALNHSAARHKISVKPKRTHGAPRRRRIQQLASGSPLPSTPEVNEEAPGRSVSPELKTSTNDELSTAAEEGTVLHSIANLLPAETQLKSASLPPGLALPASLPPAETPAVMKLSRSRSNVAYRQTESVMHHYQRSISEQDVAPVTRLVHQYYSKTETDIISHALVTTDAQKRICGTLGEENEEVRQDDILIEDMYKEKDKDDKKKDDSSFFRKFIRRSGKKKKEAPEVDSTPNTSSKVPTVPKRLDIKGRYIEPVSEYAPSHQQHYVGRTGSARGTPAARQRVKPINIPASPDVQRRLETEKEIEEMTIGIPVPSNLTPPVSELESLKVNRMQVSYAASPPKPTWPESIPAWKDNYGIDPDLGTSEVHFKPRMRIAGLSSYQQRVSQLGSELREEREYSSLIDTVLSEEFSEVTKQNAVKKSKSFRREPETSQGGFLGDLDSIRVPQERSSKNDPLWKYEGINWASRQSEVIASHPASGLDAQGRLFAKNSGSSSRNVIGMENSPVARVRTSKVPERFMKKSASLDSISSFGESKKSPSPEPKKSSSSESMSSYTQVSQTDGPVAEQENTSMDVPKPSTVVFNIKSALLEPLKSSAEPRLSSERMTLKPIHEHRVHVTRPRPVIPSPTTETVPEFLRVQLNRVDSKPATNVVLSTSAVFDSTAEEKSGRVKRKESISVQQEKPSPEEDAQSIKERKLSKEDDKTVDSVPGKSEEVTLRTPVSKQESDGSQKQRSKSLPGSNGIHVSNRKYSVVTVTPTSTVKPMLKKQSSSLESVEDRKAFIKKQISQDYEDITIIEKPSTSSVVPESNERKTLVKEEEVTATVLESSAVEVVLRSKKVTTSRDLCSKKDEDQSSFEKRFSSTESTSSQESKKFGLLWKDEENTERRTSGGDEAVVLRKKSVTRSDIGRGSSMGKDEEPELLKVFARRSLKLKDSESEALGQQVGAKTRSDSTSEQHGTKSRDSDKENEGGDSPREERKKQLIKEPLAESKLHIDPSELPPVLKVSSPCITLNNASRNGNLGIGANKYQRCTTVTLNNENGLQNDAINVYRKENTNNSPDKRQRIKTVPESPKMTDPSIEKTPHRAWANIYKEKDIDITNSTSGEMNPEETGMPKFKRIQQRKEEWELRAQQALKKTLP